MIELPTYIALVVAIGLLALFTLGRKPTERTAEELDAWVKKVAISTIDAHYRRIDKFHSVSDMRRALRELPEGERKSVIRLALQDSRFQFTWSVFANEFGVCIDCDGQGVFMVNAHGPQEMKCADCKGTGEVEPSV